MEGAETVGWKVGDQIVDINGAPVGNVDTLVEEFQKAKELLPGNQENKRKEKEEGWRRKGETEEGREEGRRRRREKGEEKEEKKKKRRKGEGKSKWENGFEHAGHDEKPDGDLFSTFVVGKIAKVEYGKIVSRSGLRAKNTICTVYGTTK